MKEIKKYSQYMYSYPHKKAYYKLNNNVVYKYLDSLKNTNISLYIHIPFCSTKCGYCNLFSIATTSKQLIDNYISTLCRQIEQYSKILKNKNVNINEIIFGGGTPFILELEQFEKLFNCIKEKLNVNINEIGFDIETSPNETTIEKLQYLKNKGMKRISIGIQSLQQEELSNIYRHHKVEQCYNALEIIKNENIKIFNVDLIYGIEGQTIKSFEKTLLNILKFNPTEIFLYPLYIREDTPLFNKFTPNILLQQEIYNYSKNILEKEQFIQTSMRRFTKNININNENCGFEQTISIGCGGRSYIGNLHFCEPYKVNSNLCKNIVENYIKKEDFTKDLVGYILNEDEQKRRFIIKNLGYYKGINLFKDSFDLSKFSNIFQSLYDEKYVKYSDSRIMLTEKGLENADNILMLFVSNEVNKRLKNDN